MRQIQFEEPALPLQLGAAIDRGASLKLIIRRLPGNQHRSGSSTNQKRAPFAFQLSRLAHQRKSRNRKGMAIGQSQIRLMVRPALLISRWLQVHLLPSNSISKPTAKLRCQFWANQFGFCQFRVCPTAALGRTGTHDPLRSFTTVRFRAVHPPLSRMLYPKKVIEIGSRPDCPSLVFRSGSCLSMCDATKRKLEDPKP